MIVQNFTCKNSAVVRIEIDDDNDYCTTVYDAAGNEIGGMSFRLVDDGLQQCYLLTWAYLDRLNRSHVRQGIGQRILQLVAAHSGEAICAREHDGIVRDDGSHLTQDAPAFVERMKELGLLGTF